MSQMPGQPMTTQQIPGQPMTGQQMPGQPMTGQQIPGQQIPMTQPQVSFKRVTRWLDAQYSEMSSPRNGKTATTSIHHCFLF